MDMISKDTRKTHTHMAPNNEFLMVKTLVFLLLKTNKEKEEEKPIVNANMC